MANKQQPEITPETRILQFIPTIDLNYSIPISFTIIQLICGKKLAVILLVAAVMPLLMQIAIKLHIPENVKLVLF